MFSLEITTVADTGKIRGRATMLSEGNCCKPNGMLLNLMLDLKL
jgi:hypothetical protein